MSQTVTQVAEKKFLAQRYIYGALGIVLLLLAWQWGSTQVTSEGALPSVPAVFAALGAMVLKGSFWIEVAVTLGIAMAGWIIAAVIGVVLGVLVGTSQWVNAATRFVLEFLRPIPAIVILPLAMLVLGPTLEMGVFLVVFGVTLPITAQTASGVEAVDPVMLNTARSFGMKRAEILGRIVLPGAASFIGTAMRVAAPVTLIMVVVAGMLGGAPGMGSSLIIAQISGRNEDIFVYVIALGVLGLFVHALASKIERKLLHWHSSFRTEG